MRKAVFFDIDGTILDKGGYIPDSTKDAIHQLRKNGHYAFICSGRTRSFIRNEELLAIGFDGILAGCGTHVEFEEKVLYEQYLPLELLTETVKILKDNRMPIVLEGPEVLYMDEADFEGDPFLTILKNEMGDKLVPITGNEQNWKCNKISVNVVEENIANVLGVLREYYEIIMHGNEFMEIVPKGHNKASGIDYICKHLGIEKENTYGLGDSSNDIEMLQYVKHGIAMGNGTKDAFEVADYITKPLREDGLAYALKHYELI